ncbi:LysR family transcriptional regulator [Cupriavidus respiraculi]|uniref:HTH lysR-type domain-containing protein n=1 Tax=Cupriavidus respiraculi TaxID=195930 RepID=A0ABM8WV03_9BURK|nr:LysR family transcriptional regulator [Cupriavidus respiraculi]CAG9171342.1 hypothetical protein LMG21510_01616 [Cupriavidus respiraculi]
MNLRRLAHFLAVVEDGSLAAAARRVHLSQPALTRSIHALEADAGMPLLDRGARGVTLTTAGHMVAERARRILFETRCLERDLTLFRQNEIGSVRIGLGPFPAAILLPQLLCALQTEAPGVQVAADVNHGAALLQALHAETLDLLVADHRHIPESTELETLRLPPEAVGFFARAGHPLHGGPLTLASLRQQRLISVQFPADAVAQLRKVFRCRPGEDVPIQVQSNDFRALCAVAAGSDAILLAPVRALAQEVAGGLLKQLELPQAPPMTVRFMLVYLARRSLSPAAGRVVSIVRMLSEADAL